MILYDNEIRLRAPEPEDVDSLYILENDPRTWNDGATLAPLSRKQLWDYISTYDGDIFSAGQLRLVIEFGGELAGEIDLYDFDKIARRAYVGIIVKEQYRGERVATRALKLLLEYAVERLALRQLAAVVRAGNEPSERLFEKQGFVQTGYFRAWLRSNESWADARHYQLDIL